MSHILGFLGVVLIIAVLLPIVLAWSTIMVSLAILMTCIIGIIMAFVFLSDKIRLVYRWFMRTAGVR